MNNNYREEEECEEVKAKSRDRSLRTYLSNGDTDETESNSAEVRFLLFSIRINFGFLICPSLCDHSLSLSFYSGGPVSLVNNKLLYYCCDIKHS